VREPELRAQRPPPQPTFRTGDVTLRPWRAEDADVAILQHDDVIAKWFGFPAVTPSADQQHAAIERWADLYARDRQTVNFLVEHAGAVAGTVEVRQLGDRVGELSWAVYPDHRHQHVATTAVLMLVDYCFEELDLVRIQARVEPTNVASLRTAGRAGLRREGLMRQAETVGGQRRDFVLLARIAGDPPPTSRDGFLRVLNAALPTKRVIAQGLVRSHSGKVLLCELTYKREWDLPGGVVDLHESPAQAVTREIREEIGLSLPNLGLRLVNWLPPWRGWDDACLFVFDLGVHDEALVRAMTFEAREIAAVHWCSLAEAEPHVAPYLRTLLACLTETDGTTYLEAGHPVDPSQNWG
jgi:RimJ/RimL family protein N-acetyltransferase/8-oxo-dGTP pyrophosphatase MutT (NUDIX family)